MRHIAIAYDFSGPSVHALQGLALLGRLFSSGLTVTLLCVTNERTSGQGTLDAFSLSASYQLDRQRLRASLEQVGTVFGPDVKLRTELLDTNGSVTETLATWVDTHRPDMLVVGSAGRTGISRIVYGSVSEVLALHASVPVLVWPEKIESHFRPSPVTRIVLATDINAAPVETLVLTKALYSALHPDAQLTILHVAENLTRATFEFSLGVPKASLSGELQSQAEAQLATLVSQYYPGLIVNSVVMRAEGVVADELEMYVHAHSVDLLVIARRQADKVRHAFAGNAVKQLLRTAMCPTLVVPETKWAALSQSAP